MKRQIFVTFLAAVLCLTSCTSKKEQQLKEKILRDSFSSVIKSQNDQMQILLTQIQEIDNSLSQIASQYAELQELSVNTREMDKADYSSIQEKIAAISDMIAKDKQKLATLENNIRVQKNSFEANKRLQAKIDEMTQQLLAQEEQVNQLTQQLQDRDIQLGNMSEELKKLQTESKKNKAALADMEDERYSGYFIVGTKKELKKAGIIDSKGGFIGIGKTIVLANNGGIENMQKIDIRNINEIPLIGKKIQIITPHAKSSYSLTGDANKPSSIVIDSRDEFWRTSRCLVIMIK